MTKNMIFDVLSVIFGIVGGIVIIGTAGASDCEAIGIAQMLKQVAFGFAAIAIAYLINLIGRKYR